MAKSRKHRNQSSPPPSSEPSKFPLRLVGIVLAIIVVLIPFSVGKYCEFKMPGPFDSSGYVYSAYAVVSGARIGIDHRPSAQMGTLLLNMLGVKLFGFNEMGSEIIQMLLQMGALVLMGIALNRLYGWVPAALGALIASFYLSAPHLAKYGNVKEQFMIAFMIMGISCYVLGQLQGRWWWTVLAGMALSWGPLFKETGTSAIGGVGLFVIFQAIFKARSWKATLQDIGLLIGGFLLGVLPVILWLSINQVEIKYWPYRSLIKVIVPAGGERVGGYVTDARKMIQSSDQMKRVMRYYMSLIVPIGLAIVAMVLSLVHTLKSHREKKEAGTPTLTSRFVWLFAIWFAFDMAYVWISPRTYEQYFLPLNASAAMCGAFVFAWFGHQWTLTKNKGPWMAGGVIGAIVLVSFAMPMVIGMNKSPHSGAQYKNYQTGQPERRRGYIQRLNEVKNRRVGPWQQVGDLIRQDTDPNDTIYVWGWYPGIYVQAQRLSNAPKAFEGNMHTYSPVVLGERVQEIMDAFEKQAPKYIVDSRKRHFPWNRPNLELWPKMPDPKTQQPKFIDPRIADQFDKAYEDMLRQRIDEDEAQRYAAMKPFRDYVMQNYQPVIDSQHAVFKRK